MTINTKLLKLSCLGCGAILALVLLLAIGGGITLWFVPSYWLPSSANVLESHCGPSDFHGDFSYCARFTLDTNEFALMKTNGLRWFQPYYADEFELPIWKRGILPDEIARYVSGLDVQLQPGPNFNREYEYYWKFKEGGSWRLIAIDPDSREIFYYKCSW